MQPATVQRSTTGDRRALATVVAAVLLLGTANSLYGPYLALFAADEARLGPVQVGVLASATGLSGIVISSLFGRRFDRRPTRLYTVLGCLAGAAGFALLTVTRDFGPLLLLSLTLLGADAVAFPQLFALARHRVVDGATAHRATPVLRAVWSLAWAMGPFAGALLLHRAGFNGIFWFAALFLALTAVATLVVPAAGPEPDHPAEVHEPPAPIPTSTMILLVAGITLFFTAMFAGSLALPLFVTGELGLPATSIGPLTSACAAMEVLAALVLALVPARAWLVPAGMLLMAVFLIITLFSHGMVLLLVGQALRGIAIAVVGVAGIKHFQEVMAPATARATTLFSNASTAGLLVSGLLAGVWLEVFGYRTTFGLCALTAVLAAVAFGSRSRR